MIFALALTPAFSVTFEEVCAALTVNEVTTGDFSQEKTAQALKRPLKSSGKFIISGEGIAWLTQKPFRSTTAVTKTAIIQISADGRKTVTDGEGNSIFMSVAETISAIFRGDREALDKNFFVDFSEKEGVWTINLTPRDSTISSAISSIEMHGKTGAEDFESVFVAQANGDEIRYFFSNQKHKEALSDDEKILFQK